MSDEFVTPAGQRFRKRSPVYVPTEAQRLDHIGAAEHAIIRRRGETYSFTAEDGTGREVVLARVKPFHPLKGDT